MEYLIGLTLNLHAGHIPLGLALVCFVMAFAIFVYLIVQQQFGRLYTHWDERYVAEDEETIIELLATQNSALLAKLHRRRSTRDLIVRFSGKLQGDSTAVLVAAYSYLGFAIHDIKLLASAPLVKRMQALQRCRLLRLPLPDEAWRVMLNHSDLTYRWAAMEYLVLSREKESLLWLSWFLNQAENRETGMALHLSCCLAKTSPSVFPFLLDHSRDIFLTRIWLHTLSLYPVPGSEGIVMNKIGDKPNSDLLMLGMRALAAAPSETTKRYLFDLANHRDWNVRRLLAELLQGFQDPQVVHCLEELSEDMSFPVRMQALESLLVNGEEGRDVLRGIARIPDHPSHSLIATVADRELFGDTEAVVELEVTQVTQIMEKLVEQDDQVEQDGRIPA
ncbi:MAG: HEAT repeat domain-containing protein [Proteobacteria bacterium]|nr:MAG: HEAT repeat domain-containing protein [Pseudomonadota bacterium]